MTIKITGISQVLKEIKNYSESVLKNGKAKVLDDLVDDLKRETPVDTGKARNGWYHTRNAIHNDVEYIDELNAGSSQQAPSYFIERTLLKKRGIRPNGIIVTKK